MTDDWNKRAGEFVREKGGLLSKLIADEVGGQYASCLPPLPERLSLMSAYEQLRELLVSQPTEPEQPPKPDFSEAVRALRKEADEQEANARVAWQYGGRARHLARERMYRAAADYLDDLQALDRAGAEK